MQEGIDFEICQVIGVLVQVPVNAAAEKNQLLLQGTDELEYRIKETEKYKQLVRHVQKRIRISAILRTLEGQRELEVLEFELIKINGLLI